MITHLPQFITVKEYAARHKLTARTTRDRIRRKVISYTIICGNKLIVEPVAPNQPPDPNAPHVQINKLEWVPQFAKKRRYAPDTIYQHIIFGKINAVVIANLVLVNPEDETVIAFLKNNPPLKRRK